MREQAAHRGVEDSANPLDRAGVQTVLRPLATPLPLGFLGQAVASWAFACLQLSWLKPSEGHLIALGVLIFTVPLQATSCVMGFLVRDPVAATGTGILAGGWALVATGTLLMPPGGTSNALGVLAIGVAGVLLIPALISLGRLAAGAVLVLSVARFTTTAIAEWVGTQGWLHVAGWVGLALSAVSLYAAAAFEINAMSRRTWLPLGRLSKRANDPLAEPGVRPEL